MLPRRASGTGSGAVQAVAADPHAIADVELAEVAALERARRAVVEPDVDTVADDRLANVAFDVVAGDRAARCAEAGHRRAAEAMAELVADDRAGDAADDRAGTGALRTLVDRLDALDRAELACRRSGAVRDARTARRGGGRAGEVIVGDGSSGRCRS